MAEKHYVYIFVRQDISAEQQLVQSSHVALMLGSRLGRRFQGDQKKYKIDDLYFTVIGITTLKDFVQVQKDLSEFQYECFYEPDIGHEMTAIATYPIHHKKRGTLRTKYKLLKFNQSLSR